MTHGRPDDPAKLLYSMRDAWRRIVEAEPSLVIHSSHHLGEESFHVSRARRSCQRIGPAGASTNRPLHRISFCRLGFRLWPPKSQAFGPVVLNSPGAFDGNENEDLYDFAGRYGY
jgi:hypothetical protein